jgi:asparagine synthase (glutamine-hydrolysing)
MCGIAGILNLQSEAPIEEGRLRQMLAMIRHRGPDQFGIYLDERVGLGSARLNIVDLESGQQPITSEDGSLWIVYNGEVFNHVELRPELEAHGHRFTTHTDTEVILHLYEEEGPACLERLNGQFAIAIWDTRDRSLFLARDRLGVRPLFYTVAGGAFIFGSEVKAILADPRVRAELDPVALHQVFSFWSPLSPRSAFRGISELPPGHYLVVRDGDLAPKAYWELTFAPEEDPERGEQDYLEELRALLVDAVRIRLRADVPVGAYLSGGLDSSTIAAAIRRFTDRHLDTFSIAFDDSDYDESAFQQRMAKFLGTEHRVVHASHEDIGRVFPEVIWHTETPILRTAPAPMFLLSRLVRDAGYKVVLTGEGADELLAGYDIFKETKIRRFWARRPESRSRPALLKRLYPDIGALARTGDAFLRAFFAEGLTDLDAPSYSHAIRWRTTARIRRLFSRGLLAAAEAGGTEQTPGMPPAAAAWDWLERAQYLEISVFLSQHLLSSQGDRMAMAHSVEGRFPFLDYRVVDLCGRLPSRLKLRGLTDKYLLRKLAREWLPDEIWRRGKRPYRAPIHRSFFNDGTRDYLDAVLAPDALAAAGCFHAPAVAQLVAKVRPGTTVSETDQMALAGIVSTQLWHEQFVRRLAMPPPLSEADDVKVSRMGRRTDG